MFRITSKFIVPTLFYLSISPLTLAAPTLDPVDPKTTSERASAQPLDNPSEKKSFIDNLTGQLVLTSNYIFRGLTQTENLPSVQGGYTYTFPYGIYATIYAANNKYLDTDVNLELDPGIGIHKEVTKDFNFDISFYRYYFPSLSEWNYNEWLGQFNFKFLQSNLGYSKNVFNVKHKGFYYDGGINYTFPAKYLFGLENVTLLALVGRYELPAEVPDAAGISYNNYTVSLSKDFKNFNFALQYSNTNERAFYGWYGGEHFFCTLTASF